MVQKCMLIAVLVLCSAYAQEEDAAAHPAPEPYSFAFESTNDDGSSTAREETGDAEGRITGWYIIKGLDGQDRRVDYVADENGFRAEVSTSELGTISHETSSAIFRSSAPAVSELISNWEVANQGSSGIRSQPVSGTSRTRITQVNPVVATRTEVLRQPATVATRTEVVREPSVITTAEGYVLVPASAARQVGLSGVDSERFGITADRVSSALPVGGGARSGGGSTTTTSTTTSRRVITSSAQPGVRFASENSAGNEVQPSPSNLIRRLDARRSALLRK